jgi:hypothetical protein
MNKQMIVKNVGKHVILLPAAIRLDSKGTRVRAPEDDYWLIEDVNDDGVLVREPRSGHRRLLRYDHLFSYTSDDPKNGTERAFLVLKTQLYVIGNEVRILPTVRPGEELAPNLAALGIDNEPTPISTALAIARQKAFDEETKRLCQKSPEPFYEGSGHLFDALRAGLRQIATETGWKIVLWDNRMPGTSPRFVARVSEHSLQIITKNLAFNSCDGAQLLIRVFRGPILTGPEEQQGAMAWERPVEVSRRDATLTRTPHFGWGFRYKDGDHSPIVLADNVLVLFMKYATGTT